MVALAQTSKNRYFLAAPVRKIHTGKTTPWERPHESLAPTAAAAFAARTGSGRASRELHEGRRRTQSHAQRGEPSDPRAGGKPRHASARTRRTPDARHRSRP